jgi:hypothetical protein
MSARKTYFELEKERPTRSGEQSMYQSHEVRILPVPSPDNVPLTNEVYTSDIARQALSSLIPQVVVAL